MHKVYSSHVSVDHSLSVHGEGDGVVLFSYYNVAVGPYEFEMSTSRCPQYQYKVHKGCHTKTCVEYRSAYVVGVVGVEQVHDAVVDE